MTTDPQYPLTDAEASAEAARLIAEVYRPEVPATPPTAFRDTTPIPAIGTTPPVPQPESRIVPQWAAGVAVASIGVGAGITGLGCGAWLVLQGLSSVTLLGVLALVAPFAGVAAVATAIGSAISRARSASTTHIYKGTVVQRTEVTATARGMLSRAKAGR
ncbi:hypothetical protein [Streptomyces griseofuscus]|uniref:Transmembrane protein n=1 Tax=Streptomyces griseofuscus TaxID=146922 RepID=A0A426RVG3_9ACTN|nr:hypothetical protein [Streptomyces griseofuscus]RRQ77561.1 hypothetical protein CQW44_37580 [Streptomyces griseofuscus]